MTETAGLREKLAECSRRHENLARSLSTIGYVWPGTLQPRMLTCGKKECACHGSPDARHGPYFYWTSKKNGRTISRKVDLNEAEVLRAWIGNRRAAEAILKQMKDVSAQALELLLEASLTN